MQTTPGGALALGALLLLCACGSNTEQRAATGGLGGVVAGALLGGPIGAVAGAAAGGTAGVLVDKAVEHSKQSKTAADQTTGPTDLTRRAEDTGEVPTPTRVE
jgi:outer membrane lipoprotein SlyB